GVGVVVEVADGRGATASLTARLAVVRGGERHQVDVGLHGARGPVDDADHALADVDHFGRTVLVEVGHGAEAVAQRVPGRVVGPEAAQSHRAVRIDVVPIGHLAGDDLLVAGAIE